MSIKNHVYFLILLLLSFAALSAQVYDDFVVETKRIHIPGYPCAFNPSLIEWQDGFLMSFRVIQEPIEPELQNGSSGISKIGLVRLNDKFQAVSEPQILNLCSESERVARAEDARLLIVGRDITLVYSDNNDLIPSEQGFRMCVAKLHFEGDDFKVEMPEKIVEFSQSSLKKREKNWAPFDFNGCLLFNYSLNPQRLMYYVPGSGSCPDLIINEWTSDWAWGELRGGTPAVVLDQDRYIAFFHSSIPMTSIYSNGELSSHYFMGAYTFSRIYPFNMMEISQQPIIGQGFYDGESYLPYWKPVVVIFPCGIIVQSDHIWVSYGRQDHELWVAKLDKAKLLQSLEPINDR